MRTQFGKMIVGAQAAVMLAGSLAVAQAPAVTESATLPPGFKLEFIDRSKLPAVPVPAGYEEGYLPNLSEIDIKEVEQFAKNSFEDLKDLLDMAAKVTDYWEKRALLKRGMDEIIKKSQPLKTELLMRNVLERAVIMVNLIDAEVQNDSKRKGIVDQQVRLLKESVGMSKRYWEPYLRHVNGQALQANVDLAKINYRQFGVRYSNLLWSVANSIFDASAEYKLRLEALKLLMWDLYRDENKLELNQAGAIAKIYSFVKNAPDTSAWTDDEFVERTKLLRIVKKEAFERLGSNPDLSASESASRRVSDEVSGRACGGLPWLGGIVTQYLHFKAERDSWTSKRNNYYASQPEYQVYSRSVAEAQTSMNGEQNKLSEMSANLSCVNVPTLLAIKDAALEAQNNFYASQTEYGFYRDIIKVATELALARPAMRGTPDSEKADTIPFKMR